MMGEQETDINFLYILIQPYHFIKDYYFSKRVKKYDYEILCKYQNNMVNRVIKRGTVLSNSEKRLFGSIIEELSTRSK